MAVLAYPQAMLFVVFAAYALSGVLEQGWKLVAGMMGKNSREEGTPDGLHK
jgi:hypothetical protein